MSDGGARTQTTPPTPGVVRPAHQHPRDWLLRQDRLPHIWCPTCGIGTCVSSFVEAVHESGIPEDQFAIVSGIGCTGRVAGYVKLDSFHTTHGRAIPFATGLKLAKPELHVVVFSGDGDLFAIGGNHFIHAARRNVDITVICINNFNFGMTGGQGGPTTPLQARTTTTPYGCVEYPFNLAHLAAASGASYVARWTVLNTYELRQAIIEAMAKRGFSFVEVVSPCPTGYARRNKLGSVLDQMKYYKDHARLADKLDPENTALPFKGDIAIGKFVDIEKPTFQDMYNEMLAARAGGREKK